MVAKDDIRGRLFGLAVSALLLAEAYALWKPQALGGLPQPDLGPFSHYRLVIALLTAGAGVVVLLASLNRDVSREEPPQRRRETLRALDPGATGFGRPPGSPPRPATQLTPRPPALPSPPVRPAARPAPPLPLPLPAPPMPAPVPVEDIQDLDPFPGLEPVWPRSG